MLIEKLRAHKEWLVIIVLALTSAWIWLFALQPAGRSLRADFLDVGQGDCTLIRTPSGRTMLVDGGGRAGESNSDLIGMSIVEPVLRRNGINRIDIVVLTHPHEDHVQGLIPVVRDFRIGIVLDAGIEGDSPDYKKFLANIRDRRIEYRRAARGMVVDFGDGVNAQVLNPSPQGIESTVEDANDESLVMRITYSGHAVMLTGDAGFFAESDMVESGFDLRSDVLKVGHHGSAGSTGEMWVRAVQPRFAVISVGRNNSFGHPSRDTLRSLSAAGVKVYRTDENGQVSVHVTSQGCAVECTH